MSTHDTQGRPWAKLSEIKEGNTVRVDGDFTCIPKDETRTVHWEPQGRYIVCSHGKHYLTGQLSELDNDSLVGVYHAR